MYADDGNGVPYCVDCIKQTANRLFFLSWIGNIKLYNCRNSCY